MLLGEGIKNSTELNSLSLFAQKAKQKLLLVFLEHI